MAIEQEQGAATGALESESAVDETMLGIFLREESGGDQNSVDSEAEETEDVEGSESVDTEFDSSESSESEESESDDESDEEDEEDGEEGQETEEEEPKGLQKRVNKLTRKWKEAEERNTQLQAKLQRLVDKLEKSTASPKEAGPEKPIDQVSKASSIEEVADLRSKIESGIETFEDMFQELTYDPDGVVEKLTKAGHISEDAQNPVAEAGKKLRDAIKKHRRALKDASDRESQLKTILAEDEEFKKLVPGAYDESSPIYEQIETVLEEMPQLREVPNFRKHTLMGMVGQDLFGMAQRYGVSVDELLAKGTDNLKLPTGAKAKAKAKPEQPAERPKYTRGPAKPSHSGRRDKAPTASSVSDALRSNDDNKVLEAMEWI